MINVKLIRKKAADVAYCPNCFNLLDSANNLAGWLSTKTYKCLKCGYSGSFYVTKDLEDDDSTNSRDEKTTPP